MIMETQVTKIEINKIRMDGGTQPREVFDEAAIQDYAEAMQHGAKFPPVIVFHDGENYWLADGFHRVKAAVNAGLTEADCDVRQGSQADAQWFSFSANKTNGLHRTNEDKQRAVKAALLHPKGAGLSDNQIAEHVGVSDKTVAAWREKLETTSEIPKSTNRKGRDGRRINTANIGRRRRQTNSPTSEMATGVDRDAPDSIPPDEQRRAVEMQEAGEGRTAREAKGDNSVQMPKPLIGAWWEPSLRVLWERYAEAHGKLLAAWDRASEDERRKLSARSAVKKFIPSQPWCEPVKARKQPVSIGKRSRS